MYIEFCLHVFVCLEIVLLDSGQWDTEKYSKDIDHVIISRQLHCVYKFESDYIIKINFYPLSLSLYIYGEAK